MATQLIWELYLKAAKYKPTMEKPKLLIIAPAFYPQKRGGGPIVSVMNIVKSIKDNFDLYIISNNFELDNSDPLEGIEDGWNSFDFAKVYYFPFSKNTVTNNLKIIRQVKPNIIYKNGFFSYNGL